MSILYLDRIEIVKKYTMREYTDLKSAPTVSNTMKFMIRIIVKV